MTERRTDHASTAAPVSASPASAPPSADGDMAAAFASIIAAASGLSTETARRAAASLLDPAIYPVDYLGRIRRAWHEPDREFVAHLFQLLLGRPVDAASSDAHAAALASGTSRLAMVRAIATSPEAVARGLPAGWLSRLVTLAPELDATRPGRSHRLLERLQRSARRLLRLPWMIEQTHLLATAHGRQIAAQERAVQEAAERVAATAHEQRLHMATMAADWSATRAAFVDQQRTVAALRAEVEALSREVRELKDRLAARDREP